MEIESLRRENHLANRDAERIVTGLEAEQAKKETLAAYNRQAAVSANAAEISLLETENARLIQDNAAEISLLETENARLIQDLNQSIQDLEEEKASIKTERAAYEDEAQVRT